MHFLNAKISVYFLNAKIRFRFIYQVTFAFSLLKKFNEKEFFYELKRIIENKDLWSEMTRYLPVAPGLNTSAVQDNISMSRLPD